MFQKYTTWACAVTNDRWRDSQATVEETPVVEAVLQPTMRCGTPDATGKRRRQQIAGDRSPQFPPPAASLMPKGYTCP